jgi:hypothetical protein
MLPAPEARLPLPWSTAVRASFMRPADSTQHTVKMQSAGYAHAQSAGVTRHHIRVLALDEAVQAAGCDLRSAAGEGFTPTP